MKLVKCALSEREWLRRAGLSLCAVFLLFLLTLAGMSQAQTFSEKSEQIVVTDVLGRRVVLDKPASRVVLARGRYFPVMGIVHPDPSAILVGWTDEYKKFYAQEYAAYKVKYPALEDLPLVGSNTAASLSVEKILSLNPDLVILSARLSGASLRDGGADSGLLQMFEGAGVPVVVLDFFVDPINNTVPSVRALGDALGHPERAQAFIEYYEGHLNKIKERVATVTERPNVLVHAHAGLSDCCNSPGTEVFNDMISFAGGHNIGADVLKTPVGKLSLEYILQRNPELYIATGAGTNLNGLKVGSDVGQADAVRSLEQVIEYSRLQGIDAVRSGKAYGIWHLFNDSPMNLILIESLAVWMHPELFSDVDVQATMDEMNEQFLLLPMRGTYWVELGAGDAL